MAEVVGGAILSALIQELVKNLASLIVDSSVSKHLEKLSDRLLSADSLLNDAEDKELKDKNVKIWIDKLNEALNKADFMIDVINTKALRRKVEGKKFLKKIKIVASSSFGAFWIKQQIKEVIERLDNLLSQRDDLGLKAGVQSKRLERSLAPLIGDPSDVYGRDGDKEAIVQLLLLENSGGQDKISVIPIVGMGGVGKTTLARLIYDDIGVKNHFEHRAWVTVSDDFDVLKLATLVFEGLSGKKSEVTELGKLGEELMKFLGGKRFFLVLDDVWNENYNHWDSLRSFLRVGSDCKIIVTTRSETIGSMMGSVLFHPLTSMEDGDCWELFQKHAFHSVEERTKQLETIGREIVKKCKGLPLAVKSLAGLLRSVSDPREWEKIKNSDVWELQRKGKNEILPSLWLSYSYLPSKIKRCFAYCSIFPKDYEFEMEKIILLWMAEGLVEGENMEEVGEEYFKTLVSSSLIQRSANDESAFVMHDLVHDLATFVSGKGFCVRLGMGDGLECFTSQTRHLLDYSHLDDLEGLSEANSLRTFISVDKNAVPKKFGCLRVLCISSRHVDKVPDSIGKLKHLRYLDLSGTSIAKLPDSICRLYNLQTLLLWRCRQLTHLPADMENLINLRHLDINQTDSLDYSRIPQCVFKVKVLRTRTKILVGSESRKNELLKILHSRERLEIFGVASIVDLTKDELEVEFKKNSHVTKLELVWGPGESNESAKDKATLDALQPHPNLKKLSIRGYGGIELSDWVANHSFSNITEVNLWDCNHCFQLPQFGQLPSLKKLKVRGLHSVKTIGSEFYGSSGATPFPCLKSLEMYEMDELESWSFEAEGAFPCLEELELKCCWKLKWIHPHCLPMLKKLVIRDCPEMEALVAIEQEMNAAFPALQSIVIVSCPEVELSGLPLPSTLNHLWIWGCKRVYAQRMQWGALKSLKTFTIARFDLDSFPEEGLLPTTLVELEIRDIRKLKSLNGKAFQQLTSLNKLEISFCHELECLPEEGLPASLQDFSVSGSPKVEERIKRGTGEDWLNISHIPNISYDNKKV